ncbi:MAG: hypothetical protein D6714_04615, partial [Bacteroidetes bacterium]
MKQILTLLLAAAMAFAPALNAQQRKQKKAGKETSETPAYFLDTVSLSGLKWRSIGPAVTSGRIADFAVHPGNRSVYFVASASGGVWKTENAGTT